MVDMDAEDASIGPPGRGAERVEAQSIGEEVLERLGTASESRPSRPVIRDKFGAGWHG